MGGAGTARAHHTAPQARPQAESDDAPLTAGERNRFSSRRISL
jgi:hypothetical protein